MSRALASWIEGVWYEGRAGSALLAPLAALFGFVVRLRRLAYRRGWKTVWRARVPVVVIGNLSVGGTGKSPLVAALAGRLRSLGYRPGILTRGHGSGVRVPTRVQRGADAARVGDEPAMLAATTGVEIVVSPDRVAGARMLEALGVEIILCDDGLQHYALARDLEVAVIDGSRGLGNGRLLPAGPLREHESRLASVDWVVINDGAGAAARGWRGRAGTIGMQLVPEAARAVADPRGWRRIEDFRGQTVHAVAGIGHPGRFFAMLRAAGLDLIEHPFADHHAYAAEDLRFDDDRPILMTAKDAVKCARFADARFWEVPVVARLLPDGAAGLVTAIERLCPVARTTERA